MGAFLTDEVNNLYVLSCQHVLSKKNEKPAEEQFQPAEEQTAKKNYMDGVERLKNCISKRREELKKPDESGYGILRLSFIRKRACNNGVV